MYKRSIKYALICGVFTIGAFAVTFAMEGNPFLDVSHMILDVFIFALFMGFAAYEFKIQEKAGFLKFWEGMTMSFLIYTQATLLFGIMLAIYFIVSADPLEAYQQAALAFLEAEKETYLQKFDKNRYQQEWNDIQNLTLSGLFLNTLLKKIISGFFVAPVISIILKKNPK